MKCFWVGLGVAMACGGEPAPPAMDGTTAAGESGGGTTVVEPSTSGSVSSGSESTDESPPLPPADELLHSDVLLNIAHAGGKGTRPEHTRLAYEAALIDGAHVLELDVHATSDGVLVLMHDETVDRTTDGTGLIKEMTWDELSQLDAGYTFTEDDGATYPYRGLDLRVPRLTEILAAFPDVPYVIEIKQGTPSIVDPFLEACGNAGVLDQMVGSAFDVAVLEELRAADPDLPTSFGVAEVVAFLALTPETEPDYTPPAEFLQVPPMQGAIPVLSPAFIERADRFGLKVHAWTINDPEEMRELIELGVDGIITDYPARLRDL